MLEKVDLSKQLPKKEYKDRMPALRQRMLQLQRACWEAKIGSLIVFEGWDCAGKGSTIRKLTEPLEPRGFKLHLTRAARTTEQLMPWMWRFWQWLPNYGEMAIFDRSWYGRVLVERVEELVDETQWRQAFRDIVDFERMLSDDGYLIVKFFLHIDKKEQKRRLKSLAQDPATSWQVDEEDWEHHRHYDTYQLAVEETLERTETEWGPWNIVEATDRYWTRVRVLEDLIRRIERAMRNRGHEIPEAYPPSPKDD